MAGYKTVIKNELPVSLNILISDKNKMFHTIKQKCLFFNRRSLEEAAEPDMLCLLAGKRVRSFAILNGNVIRR